MIVTIDGPAGAGKSTAARALSERLGFRFLDTGAMYRAVVHAAIAKSIDLSDANALEQVASGLKIELLSNQILVNGVDVTRDIRTLAITNATRYAADHPGIRTMLVAQQRAAAAHCDCVTEGRDQGSVAFPDAECKIYLTASEQTRGQRRYEDLLQRGEEVTLDEVLARQRERDQRDIDREVGALVRAPDAVLVETDGMQPGEVVDWLYQIVQQRRADF